MTESKRPRLTEFGTIIVLSVSCIFFIIVLIVANFQRGHTAQLSQTWRAAVQQIDQIETFQLIAKDLERNLFVMSKEADETAARNVRTSYENIQSELEKVPEYGRGQRFRILRDIFEAQSNSAEGFMQHAQRIGLSREEGLQGEALSAVRQLEQALHTVDDSRLLTSLLMLRRFEKDYMMIAEEKYLDLHIMQRAIFLDRLEGSPHSENDKLVIKELVDAYNRRFDQWVRARLQTDVQSNRIDYLSEKIATELSGWLTEQIELADDQSQKLEVAESWSSVLNWLVLTLSIVSGMSGILQFLNSRRFQVLMEQRRLLRDLVEDNDRLANKDSLTGLPNRRCFVQEVDKKVDAPEEEQEPFVLAILDLDGFKLVNDAFGHKAGDELLRQVGERLQSVLGDAQMIGRLGGDEFGIILSQDLSAEELQALGQDICACIDKPFDLIGVNAGVAASLGFVQYPLGGKTREELFERADYALYNAKQDGKGHAVMFCDFHEADLSERAKIVQQLHIADLEAELSVVCQPIYDVIQNKVSGFEALARWNSPVLGFVRPDRFIEAAEGIGIINRLSKILLQKALAVAEKWPDDVYLSFNLSQADVASSESMMQLIAIIGQSNVPPSRIMFEVTETLVMRDVKRVAANLEHLRSLGIKIALDDFGTGYSSLSHVSKIPIDRLKIDRTFINDVATTKAAADIVKTIADLCRNLELDCIVEGVETQEQLNALRGMGLRKVQGYLLGKPLPPHEAIALVSEFDETALKA